MHYHKQQKIELMLTRCAKAYNSSNCFRFSLAISSQLALKVRGTDENCKKNNESLYIWS